MSKPWEKYQNNSGNKPWEKYGQTENFTEEKADISAMDRFIAKNFSQSPETTKAFLQNKYPEMEIKLKEGRIFAAKKGEKDFKALDPETGFFSSDFLADAGDVAYDVGSGIAEGAATAAGGIAGAPFGGAGAIPGAMIAGGAASAGSEAIRQRLGQAMGVPQEVSMDDVKMAGGIGAVSPLLFGTGASAKQIAKAGIKESTQKGILGKAYKKLTRDILPSIGSTISGADKEALKTYIKDPSVIREVAENVFQNTDEAVSRAKEIVRQEKSVVGQQMNEHMRESGKSIDIVDLKQKLRGKITELENLTERSPSQDDYLDQLKGLKDRAFSNVTNDGLVDIPDQIDANRMFDLQDELKKFKGSKTVFDEKTGRETVVDKRFAAEASNLYKDLQGEVSKVFTNSKELKSDYAQVLKKDSFLRNRFKQSSDYPERDTNALMKLSKNKQTRDIMSNIDPKLVKAGSEARGAFQLSDPSLIPISGQGVVSTGRIAASSAIGARLAGDAIGDTRTGAALGLIGGSLMAGPAAVSRVGRGLYNVERGIQKIPLRPAEQQQTIWNLLQNKDN